MKKIIYLFILSSTSLFGQLELENLLAHYSFDGNCNVETTHEFINNGLHSGTEEYAPGINGEPNSAIRIKNNSEKIVENAVVFLLNYEPLSPSFIYKQLEEVIEKDRLNSILKKMILEESILRNKNNLLYINQ